MNAVYENINVNVPAGEMPFFKKLIEKMGGEIVDKDPLEEFLRTRPKEVDVTDEEIMEEVAKVRYKK